MDKFLIEQELIQLKKYRYNGNLEHTFNVADLLNEPFLKDFLKNLSDAIDAPSEKVAASIFIKRYAFLAVMSLYAMTAWNKKINLSIENVKMESPEQGKDWLPAISFNDFKVQDWDGNGRIEWRASVFKDLFAKNIFPLISQLEKTVGISKLILWENIAVYLFWLYETELKDLNNDNVAGDFRYLILDAEGQLFGRYNLNPLQKYFAEKTYLEEWDAEVRVRKTCCLTYQLPAGKRCKSCPCTHIAKERTCHNGESICEAVRSFA
jgi:siderophore-iron reductase FhuF